MSTWLILIIVGVVMLIAGVAIPAAKFLIWLGIAIVVVSVILSLLGRSKT